jgi:hypothetical protein
VSFDSLLTRTATVEPYEPTTDDDFNDEVIAWGEPVDYPAWFNSAPTGGALTELTVERDTAMEEDLVFLPAGAVINYLSRVTRDDGVVFQVYGPPDRVFTPRGEHHVEAKLRAISG